MINGIDSALHKIRANRFYEFECESYQECDVTDLDEIFFGVYANEYLVSVDAVRGLELRNNGQTIYSQPHTGKFCYRLTIKRGEDLHLDTNLWSEDLIMTSCFVLGTMEQVRQSLYALSLCMVQHLED